VRPSAYDCDVVIAGSGVAAVGVARRCLDLGRRPLLLRRALVPPPGLEAVAPEAQAKIEALGWHEVFEAAGAVMVEGFENHWDANKPEVHSGHYYHVDRTRLARAAFEDAVARGAAVVDCERLPDLADLDGRPGVALGGTTLRFSAAVDATGRAAVWSHPLRRHRRLTASIFLVDGENSNVRRGRVVAIERGWAYRVGTGELTGVVVLTRDGQPASRIGYELAARLGLSPAEAEVPYVARRPANPQWCANPADGRRLAVGDAAFAADPISGQGVHFAMASALAVATVVASLDRPDRVPIALDDYRDFVGAAVSHHLELLDQVYGPEGPVPTADL
jgi:flavin-dependent dehydrogenase